MASGFIAATALVLRAILLFSCPECPPAPSNCGGECHECNFEGVFPDSPIDAHLLYACLDGSGQPAACTLPPPPEVGQLELELYEPHHAWVGASDSDKCLWSQPCKQPLTGGGGCNNCEPLDDMELYLTDYVHVNEWIFSQEIVECVASQPPPWVPAIDWVCIQPCKVGELTITARVDDCPAGDDNVAEPSYTYNVVCPTMSPALAVSGPVVLGTFRELITSYPVAECANLEYKIIGPTGPCESSEENPLGLGVSSSTCSSGLPGHCATIDAYLSQIPGSFRVFVRDVANPECFACTEVIDLVCPGLQNLQLPASISASSCQGPYQASVDSDDVPVTWSIVGDTLGVSISSSGPFNEIATLSGGSESGVITVRAQTYSLCYLEGPVTVGCPSVSLTAPSDEMCPGSEMQLEASGETCVTWSIRDPVPGVQLVPDPCAPCCMPTNPQYATLRVDENATLPEDGMVTIEARLCGAEACPPAVVRIRVGCGASCSAGECGDGASAAGSGAIGNGSIDVRFHLGRGTDGDSAGHLSIFAERPNANLGSPLALGYLFDRPDSSAIRESGMLRQVRAPEVVADIVRPTPPAGSYEIRFYSPDQMDDSPGPSALWSPLAGEAPFTTWLIEKPTDNSATLRLSRYVDDIPGSGELTAVYRYEYSSPDPTEYTWILRTGESTTTESRVETKTWDIVSATSHVMTYTASQDGGTVVQLEDTYDVTGFLRRRIERRVQTGESSERVTTYGYTASGQLQYRQHPDGSWEWFGYDTAGRLASVCTPWGDAPLTPPTAPNPALCRLVEYTFDPNDKVATLVESALGVEISRTEHVFRNDATYWYTDEKRFTTQGASGSYLMTTQAYSDSSRETLAYVDYGDGRRDVYERATGSFNESATNPTFTVGSGSLERTFVRRELAASGPVVGHSTADATIRDVFERVRLQEEYVYGTSGYVRVRWSAFFYDERGRLTDTYHSDGGHEITTYSSCCGVDSRTDAQGMTTTYARDLFGRLTQTVQIGISGAGIETQPDRITTYWYDASTGRQRSGVRQSYAGAPTGTFLETIEERDWAGRTRYVIDQAGLATQYAYSSAAGGGEVATVTHPGGATEITTRARDGRVTEIEGSAVVRRTTGYAINSDGTQATTITVSPTLLEVDRWSRSTYDMVGRMLREERPAFDHAAPIEVRYTYDESAGGRLAAVQTWHNGAAVSAASRYAYDSMGDVIRTGLDIDANGTLDLGSTDRIQETLESHSQTAGVWWRITTNSVYRDGESTPTTISAEHVQLSGLPAATVSLQKSIDSFGNETIVSTTVDAAQRLVTQTTDYPHTTATSSTVSRNGLTVSATDIAGLSTTYFYDGYGRQTIVRDSRGKDLTTVYDEDGRVDYTLDQASNAIDYTYDLNTGRVLFVTNADGQETRYEYNSRGQVTRTWGDTPQPIEVEYDGYGQRVALRTYRDRDAAIDWTSAAWPNPPAGAADATTWAFDAATGLMTSKTYADATATQYDYTAIGQLDVRTWARLNGGAALTADYAHSSTTGEMTGVTYSDGTPALSMTYNRLGQLAAVTDAAGSRTFTYAADGSETTETFSAGSLFDGKVITTTFSDQIVVEVPPGQPLPRMQRLSRIRVGTSSAPQADYNATYDYDQDNGRMTRVTGPGLPTYGAVYTYRSDSSLLDKTEIRNAQTGAAWGVMQRSYDSDRPLLTALENKWGTTGGGTTVSKYAYRYDDLGRRSDVVRTGSAFAATNPAGTAGSGTADHLDLWGYNARNELTASDRYAATDPANPTNPVAALDRAYAYDAIGNRVSATAGAAAANHYCANNLNQYTTIDDASSTCPPGGTADESLLYDADGNLSESNARGMIAPGAGRRQTYIWDAENRLAAVQPVGAPASGDRKVEFAYDYRGRRIEKRAFVHDGVAWGAPSTTRFVYHGWNLLTEYSVSGSTLALQRKNTWGLDLAGVHGGSGALDSAGGIGGLLATLDSQGTTATTDDKKYVYFYDANGNVGQAVDTVTTTSVTIAARYEYDAYGVNVLDAANLAQSGPYAAKNPFRFSTKWFDDETTLGYWGYRYYLPSIGRWVSSGRGNDEEPNHYENKAKSESQPNRKTKTKTKYAKGEGDEYHAKYGAYYEYRLRCCVGGRARFEHNSGWTHDIEALMRKLEAQKRTCCLEYFMLSTHHNDRFEFVYADPREVCLDSTVADSLRLCDGASVDLNLCNSCALARELLRRHRVLNITIECTDGDNWHWPGAGIDVPGSGGKTVTMKQACCCVTEE